MSVTIFGVIVALVGMLLLVRGSMLSMLLFAMTVTLFGGSAALSLPALGGSSIPPANLALVFLLLRALFPGPGQVVSLGAAISDCIFLIIYCVYGSLTAWLLPFLFRGAMKVTPLHPGAVRQLYENAPLHFTSQNVTTSVYLLGTLAAGLGAHIGAARGGSVRLITKVGIGIAITHALLGFLSIAVASTPLNAIIEAFRNGHYAQLDQSIGGMNRMAGVWPEASGFAGYGGAWLIFTTELWLRDLRPRAAGLAAALLAAALIISTSSTAYVTLAGYVTVLGLRALLIPTSIPPHKILIVAAVSFAGLLSIMVLMLLDQRILDNFIKILRIMTVDKTTSWSGRQRLFWAMQGLDAFGTSAGLGIGAGSFRSSSLITAILGSTGIIGILSFAAHLIRAFSPLRRATWLATQDERETVSVAAGWAAVLMLMPAAVSSPSPDPGIVWAIFTGLALGMRRMPTADRAYAQTRSTRSRGRAPVRAMRA